MLKGYNKLKEEKEKVDSKEIKKGSESSFTMFNKVKSIIIQVLKLILNIIFICTGVLVGMGAAHLLMQVFVDDIPEYAWLSFYILTTATMIEISFLALVVGGIARVVNVYLFSRPSHNFAIGFLFSLIYFLLLSIMPDIKFLSDEGYIWFCFVILPIIVFLPLVYIDYLLSSRK